MCVYARMCYPSRSIGPASRDFRDGTRAARALAYLFHGQ